MDIERAAIPDVLIIRPQKHGDGRGFFSETFKASALNAFGADRAWVQDNHAYSAKGGIVRGLHFQSPPSAQAKLLRVTRGAIFDVAVDIRTGSPHFGRHVAIELSAQNWTQIFVPEGFAHGYCTLCDETEVLYKVSADYRPAEEGGLLWNDSDLAIERPIEPQRATLTDRDLRWPALRNLVSPFVL
jgi:dTDP-4-dehydrorhamnose 3,5-epimerase